MQTSKITIESAVQTILKIGTLNLANSLLDEKSETTNFFLREEAILDLIKKMDLDILTLNELRPYKNRKTGEIIQPADFLGKIKNYNHIYDYMNGNQLAFAVGILYNRSKVYPMKTVKYWLSETPEIPSDSWGNGFGRILLGVKFYPIIDEKVNLAEKPIWIYVTHLGLGEKEKNECVKIIPRLIQKDARDDHYAILGDFNFFDDLEGKQQRKVLEQSGLVDVGLNTYFSFDSSKKCYGTFLGFDHDPYKSNYETLYGFSDKIPSRLDHIWISKSILFSNVKCWVEDEKQLIERRTPSDHLPLTCEITLTEKSENICRRCGINKIDPEELFECGQCYIDIDGKVNT